MKNVVGMLNEVRDTVGETFDDRIDGMGFSGLWAEFRQATFYPIYAGIARYAMQSLGDVYGEPYA